MTSVVLVGLPDALPSCLQSWIDLFAYANRLSQRRQGPPVFELSLWHPGEPAPPCPDVVLVPARVTGGAEGTELAGAPAGLREALTGWAAQGTLMGAVCAGVFCLAEARLLDRRRATTHWSLAALFRKRFPRVILDEDALVIDEGDRILGGGMTAYFDVGLQLIRRFGGEEVAQDCASVFVLDPGRRHQSPFAPAGLAVREADPLLDRAVSWARSQPRLAVTVAQWAAAVGLEKRTLERRAQTAWGHGPAERLRRLRLDRARLLVAGGQATWEQVSDQCGYRDPGAFRRLFVERFGQTPGEYRRRFGPR